MVRGWLRPKHGPSLPPSTLNTRRGEYDSWEPLGRLLLPDLHRQVDEVVKAGRSARRLPAPNNNVQPQQSADSNHVHEPPTSLDVLTTLQSPTEVNGEEMQPAGHTGGAGDQTNADRVLHIDQPDDSDITTSHPVNEDTAGRDMSAQTATARSGTDNYTTESDNGRATTTETVPLHQPNAAATAPAGSGERHANPEPEQTVAAYYAEHPPIYSRRPLSSEKAPPSYSPRQTAVFCANCDPRAQISTTSLLSDYLCHQCRVDFTLWRSEPAQIEAVYLLPTSELTTN